MRCYEFSAAGDHYEQAMAIDRRHHASRGDQPDVHVLEGELTLARVEDTSLSMVREFRRTGWAEEVLAKW